MAVDKQTLSYVANLSRLDLKPAELEELSGQLKAILDFIDKLKSLDTAGIEPTSHILPLNNVLRQDSPRDPLAQDEALKNSPRKENGFFVVPKIIE